MKGAKDGRSFSSNHLQAVSSFLQKYMPMTTVINIAAWVLLALAGIVILGIALLAIITTVVNFSRCYRFRGHDGE